MKAVILASGVSRPRKPGKSSMGFAENFEVLQIRQRLLAHWNNPEHPYQQRFLANQAHIEEALGSESSADELDETIRERNLTSRALQGRSRPCSASPDEMTDIARKTF